MIEKRKSNISDCEARRDRWKRISNILSDMWQKLGVEKAPKGAEYEV